MTKKPFLQWLSMLLLLTVMPVAAGGAPAEQPKFTDGEYIINADFSQEGLEGWTAVHSGQFCDQGYGLIGTYQVRGEHPAATVDAVHLATEYCVGLECRWSSSYSAVTQVSRVIPAGKWTLVYDVENTNATTTKATYENRFWLKVGDQTITDQQTEWMNGKSAWTTHRIDFELTEAQAVEISLGYGTGSNNFGAANTPTLFVSHLKLTNEAQSTQEQLQNGITEGSAFAEDTDFYLYNVGTGRFYSAGSSWQTRACVADEGVPVRFVRHADGVYLLVNYVPVLNTFCEAFFEDGNAVWTDRNQQPNYGWMVTKNGDYYRLGVAAAGDINPTYNQDNNPDTFMGIDATTNIHTTQLSAMLTDGSGHHVDWLLVSTDDYNAYVADETTQPRQQLRQARTIATEHGLTFQYDDLLNDASATADALAQATEATYSQLLAAGENIVMNPTFANWSTGGWENGIRGPMPAANFNVAEAYQTNFDIYQELRGVPNGYYTVKADAFCRPALPADSWNTAATTEIKTYLYANDDRKAVKNIVDGARSGVSYAGNTATLPDGTIIPNDMESAASAFATGVYDNTVVTEVTDGVLRIGINSYEGTANFCWNCFSNFAISYSKVGADLTTYIADHEEALLAARAALQAEANSVVVGSERTDLEQAIAENETPEQSVDALTAATQALRQATQTFVAARAAYANLATIRQNLSADSYPHASQETLAALAEMEGLQPASLDDVEQMVQVYREAAESDARAEGVDGAEDLSSLIGNPDAESNVDYWQTVKNNGSEGTIGIRNDQPWTSADGTNKHKYFDGGDWGAPSWDLSFVQNITLSKGTYLLSAMMRSGGATVSLVANEASATAPAIADQGGVFDRGWNMQTLRFEVDTEQSVSIGIRGVATVQYCWMSFSQFRLVRIEKGADSGETGESESAFWKASAETTADANTMIVDDDVLSVSTVFATTLKESTREIDNKDFTHAIQVRTANAPTADVVTGTEQAGSTPLVVTAKKAASLTFFFRRQAGSGGGYQVNDNKDLKMVCQDDPSTLLDGTENVEEEDGSTYAYGTKTCQLEAGHTYTVFATGTTIMLYGMKWKEELPWTGITINYEDEVIDWATSYADRFVPVIMSDGDNHYLSVNQDTRWNNGTTLNSTSLKNVVPEGEDFVLEMDLKLGNAFNDGAATFSVYDREDASVMLSLTGTATNSADWKVNGTQQTVTLPNSGDVRYKTINNITWCSMKLVRTGKLTLLAITNKETGDEILPMGFVQGASNQGGLGRMEFVTTRYSANFAIDNVVVRPAADDDIPELTPTTCTVHFVDGQGNSIRDDEVVSTIVGIEYEATDDLKADFVTADGSTKYIYVAGTTIETTDDASQNEVTLTFREAAKWHYALNAVDRGGTLIKQMAAGERFEGDEFMQPYSLFIAHNGLLWRTSPQPTGEYRRSVSMTEDNLVLTQTYDLSAENPVFVAEAEDIEGMTRCTNGNMTIRSSNAACAYAESPVTAVTLPSGDYWVFAGSSVPGNRAELIIRFSNSVQDEEFHMTTDHTNMYQNSYGVWTDRPIQVTLEGGNANAGFDFIAIVKTADVEDVTQPLGINADEMALLRAAHAAMENTDQWNNKWNTDTDAPTAGDLPGVTVDDGHITAIDLPDNGLTGHFPCALLSLPYLEQLNLGYNQLSGNLGEEMEVWQQKHATVGSSLTSLFITYNELEGNIGQFAHSLPSLAVLHAACNKFTEVSPMISSDVSLDISGQTISQEVTLHPGRLTADELAQLPTILTYDHWAQDYSADWNRVWLQSRDEYPYWWDATCQLQSGRFFIFHAGDEYSPVYNPFRGQSGDILNATTSDGHNFPVRLTFGMGDANFDGAVSVLDVQKSVNATVLRNDAFSPMNFTAANLWPDDQINVQDVVLLVDMLIGSDTNSDSEEHAADGTRRPEAMADAVVSVDDNGLLSVSSSVPVAAFDITVAGTDAFVVDTKLRQQGFACRSEHRQDGVRIIGYSLAGATLPSGTTTLGRVAQGVPTRAQLADQNARAISTTLQGGETTAVGTIATRPDNSGGYRMSIGRKRAVVIGSDGRKTMERETFTTK